MVTTKLELDAEGKGAFIAEDEGKKVGEMVISISTPVLTVYHTEVIPEMEGKGVAKQLLATLLSYAQTQQLKILPLCPYVHAVFKRDPAKYESVWYKQVLPKKG